MHFLTAGCFGRRCSGLIVFRVPVEEEHAEHRSQHDDARDKECVTNSDRACENAAGKRGDGGDENLDRLQRSDHLRNFFARARLRDQRDGNAIEPAQQSQQQTQGEKLIDILGKTHREPQDGVRGRGALRHQAHADPIADAAPYRSGNRRDQRAGT